MTSLPSPTSESSSSFADELAAFIDAEVSLGGEPVLPETDLVMTGLVDSLGVVLIVDWLERRLGISIDPADVVIEFFDSVEHMVGYLRGRGDCSVD
jgi:acyl carrier protein